MQPVEPVKARFPAQPASVTAARRFVTETVATAGLPELVDDVRLLVSELATNSVIHARTEFTVTVHLAAAGVYVEVQDGGEQAPEMLVIEGHEVVEQGRGLHLLDAAASTWGCRTLDHGKVVWFRIER